MRKGHAVEKNKHFHGTICLILMSIPKIGQMNHALKMSIFLHCNDKENMGD